MGVITFVGDISLNDKYIELYRKGINPFYAVQPILNSSDFVVGNLECMAKGKHGENKFKIPRLTTNVDTLKYLKQININVVCLAHNHIYDHLEDGYQQTTQFLKKNSIRYLGAGDKNYGASIPLILEKNGIKAGILNYVTKDTNPNLSFDSSLYLNYFEKERSINEIKELKAKVNYVILCLHWGGRIENGLYPDWDQPKIAKQLVDAGADLIIGHHSHTIQPYEVYKGKYIFYSLGNFCFSDIYNENKLYSRLSFRQKKGMIVRVELTDSTMQIKKSFVKNKDGYIIPNKNIFNVINITQQQLFYKIIQNHKLFWLIYYFKLNKINPVFNYIFVQKGNILKLFNFKKVIKHIQK